MAFPLSFRLAVDGPALCRSRRYTLRSAVTALDRGPDQSAGWNGLSMALKTSSSDAVRKAGAGGIAPGSERTFADGAAWPLLWPLLAFAAAAMVIGWPWLSGQVTIPWDAKATFQPQIQFLAQSLANGQSPFWAPFRVQRPSADRRSPGDDLLAALPPAVAAHLGAELVGGRCDGAGHGVRRRRGTDAVVPRPGLALGGRARRRARVLLRRFDGLAHPAHRPGAEPCLSAARHGVPRARPGAQLASSTALLRALSQPASCSAAIRWRCSSSTCSSDSCSGACSRPTGRQTRCARASCRCRRVQSLPPRSSPCP